MPVDQSTPQTSRPRRVSRLQVLAGALAGIVGAAASPALGGLGQANAAGLTEDDALNFVAEGPAKVGFGTATDKSGGPLFDKGVDVIGTSYGVLGRSPNVGIRGGGDNNTTGVLGASFTDATEKSHGSGSGVEGHSGTGFGVAGFSETNAGVYGSAQGVSGVGVSGSGVTGVAGVSDAGTGVLGSASSGSGVTAESTSGSGLTAKSRSAPAVTAVTASLDQPAVLAQNTAIVPKHSSDTGSAAGGIRGESGHSYGVAGVTSAAPGAMAVGVGVAGIHANGYGTGVAGYSLPAGSPTVLNQVPVSTGVYGAGEVAGVQGVSGSGGEGVRGINVGSKAGVAGLSFSDASQSKAGSGAGVQGTSGTGSGVAGFSDSGAGVYGQSKVIGVSGKGAIGVAGQSSKGAGVMGQTRSGAAVKGEAKSGSGVVGTTSSHSNAAMFAVNTGSGQAVKGSSKHGYGAEFTGGAAPMRLVPRGSAGPPHAGSHQTGELVVDAKGNLYLCTSSGTPGRWRRVVLQ